MGRVLNARFVAPDFELTSDSPRNLIPSKEFFFFGTESYEPKSLAHYQKSEKSTETAHSNIAWASESGKGLLFVGDKKTPSSIISLVCFTISLTSEPREY